MIQYTKLKEYKRQNLIEILPLQKPFTLLIEPSNYCNFKCISCFQSLKEENYLTKHHGLMDLELYQKIIGQFQQWEGNRLKVLKLSLYGEPLTNPHFGDMLRIAGESGIAERIETTTNASLLTEETAEQMVRYGLDYIRVSIYGGNQKRYEEVTGCAAADMQQIRENLMALQNCKKKLGKERPFVSAKMLDTYTTENEEFLKYFSCAADEVYIDKPHNWVASDEKNFLKSLYQAKQEEMLHRDMEKVHSRRTACPMAFTTMAVRSDGTVSPCCVDWAGGTNIGSVLEQNIREIWNGDRMYEFRKMQLENRRRENPSCRNCDLPNNGYYTRDNIDGFPVERLRGD